MKVALKIGVYNKEFESLNHLMSYDSSVWFDNLIFLSLWWNYFNKQTFIIYWDIQSYCACLLSLNTKEIMSSHLLTKQTKIMIRLDNKKL